MKERTIRVVVLVTVFFAALFLFSAILNRGEVNITVDMDAPTLPTLGFQVGEDEINLMASHKTVPSVSTVRNYVTPLDAAGMITVKVHAYENTISSLTYTLFEEDGITSVFEKTEEKIGETVKIRLGDVLQQDEAGVLRLQLRLDSERTATYYTWVTNPKNAHFLGRLEYVKSLHDNMLNRTDTDAVERVLETKVQSDQTLQHVTIQSSLQHATWGQMNPKLVGEVYYQVQETKEAYAGILLRYRVTTDEGDSTYNVKEYFKVRNVGEKYYLLSYDRTIEERFDTTKEVLSGKGIRLGMTPSDLSYQSNADGTVVAFVQANELWCYNETDNEFSHVFGFARDGQDVRNLIDEHRIRILSMNGEGDITFAVYGYMNRGTHEGESGAAIYFFDLGKNVVEEIAFVPSGNPYAEIEDKLGKLAYYNHESGFLYVVTQNQLQKINFKTSEQTVLQEDLTEGDYVSSSDGQFIAYRASEKLSEITVIDFAEDTKREVDVSEQEVIVPLGFIKGDFVYGVANAQDAGKTISGLETLGMYKVEICDESNEVLKTYQTDGNYILKAEFEGNMIRLQCAVKENGIYRETGEDYISNNEENTSKITLQLFQSESGLELQRLLFENGLDNRKAKILKPKQVLLKEDTRIEIADGDPDEKYTVYGHGEIIGVYQECGEAIKVAKETSGMVLSASQRYIWEEDNREAWYRNFEVPGFVVQTGETSLTASLRAVLKYEGSQVDVQTELMGRTPYQVLDENCGGEAIHIVGCSVEDVRYLIGRGTPVIALTGNEEAVVLVGYDAQTVTYHDPHSVGSRSAEFDKFDALMSGSGHTFFAYTK